MSTHKDPRVAIVGAGMSGICMAITLQRAGFHDFTVYEKADRTGGTWRENTYPGLTCDVPSQVYQYTFATNPKWSTMMSPGGEIDAYFEKVARDHGLFDHIVFGTEVVSAEYGGGSWRVRTAGGHDERFDFLVCATGLLHHPRTPDIKGLDTFAGAAFHSAQWDHSVGLDGKRVGVIGTGSTGVQIVTALSREVEHLDMFQRTAQWVLPMPNLKNPWWSKKLKAAVPAVDTLAHRGVEGLFAAAARAVVDPGWQRDLIGTLCRANLRTVRDSRLRAALTPDYEPMCKRLVMSSGFYRAVQRRNVDVVSTDIDHIEARGVVTADGVLHELDVLVLATGFDAHAFMRPMNVTGRDGLTIEQVWSEGPRAHRSVAVPGFPNMFMLMGPHSPVGNFSLVAVAEDQSGDVVRWIRKWSKREFDAVEPTTEAIDQYYAAIREALPNTVWATGCDSWYLGKDGLPEVWPWAPSEYQAMMRREPDQADYRFAFNMESAQ